MRIVVLLSLALCAASGSVHAGAAPAPGPVQSVSTLTPLPGLQEASAGRANRVELRRTNGSRFATLARPLTLSRAPAPTLRLLRGLAGTQRSADGGLMVRAVTLTTAQGPLLVNVNLDTSGRIVLLPVAQSDDSP